MPTVTIPISFTPHNTTIPPSDLTTLHHIMLQLHTENIASDLALIALLTYFYTAFSKIFQPGGDQQQHQHQQQQRQNGKQAFSKLESRIYYSSAAAV